MKHTFLFLAGSLVFAACSKNEKNATKTELITASPWKYDNAGMDANKDGSIDFSITSQLQACMTDNTLKLNTDGTGMVDEGPTKCDPSAPQSLAVTWSFTSDEANLNLGGGGLFGLSGQFKILTLNATTLKLSKDTTVAPFGAVALVVQLKH